VIIAPLSHSISKEKWMMELLCLDRSRKSLGLTRRCKRCGERWKVRACSRGGREIALAQQSTPFRLFPDKSLAAMLHAIKTKAQTVYERAVSYARIRPVENFLELRLLLLRTTNIRHGKFNINPPPMLMASQRNPFIRPPRTYSQPPSINPAMRLVVIKIRTQQLVPRSPPIVTSTHLAAQVRSVRPGARETRFRDAVWGKPACHFPLAVAAVLAAKVPGFEDVIAVQGGDVAKGGLDMASDCGDEGECDEREYGG